MILSFKQQFKEKILSGSKKHTLREDSKKRWKPGRTIHFATGVRTKKYNMFLGSQCTGIQKVFMTYAYNDLIEISVDGKELFSHSERLQFAKNDGFDTWEDFFNWFYPLIKKSPNECLSLRLIHWTDLRY